MDLLDEIAEHLLADVEVCDDAVLEGAGGLDVAGCAADHPLGLGAHRQQGAGQDVDGDHRRLVQHDALAPDVDEGVGGAQVDGDIASPEDRAASSPVSCGHRLSLVFPGRPGIRLIVSGVKGLVARVNTRDGPGGSRLAAIPHRSYRKRNAFVTTSPLSAHD